MVKKIRSGSFLQFINLGVILLFISMKLEIDEIALPFGLLQGEYEDMTANWYIKVGSQLILALIYECLAFHISPMLQFLWIKIKIFWDSY